MTRPTVRQVAARAWDIGPTWTDVLALALADLTLIWWWGVPWPVIVPASAAACAGLFGLLGWLDLQNEAADAVAVSDEEGAD